MSSIFSLQPIMDKFLPMRSRFFLHFCTAGKSPKPGLQMLIDVYTTNDYGFNNELTTLMLYTVELQWLELVTRLPRLFRTRS